MNWTEVFAGIGIAWTVMFVINFIATVYKIYLNARLATLDEQIKDEVKKMPQSEIEALPPEQLGEIVKIIDATETYLETLYKIGADGVKRLEIYMIKKKENGEFISSGQTPEEAVDNMKLRFPYKKFAIVDKIETTY